MLWCLENKALIPLFLILIFHLIFVHTLEISQKVSVMGQEGKDDTGNVRYFVFCWLQISRLQLDHNVVDISADYNLKIPLLNFIVLYCPHLWLDTVILNTHRILNLERGLSTGNFDDSLLKGQVSHIFLRCVELAVMDYHLQFFFLISLLYAHSLVSNIIHKHFRLLIFYSWIASNICMEESF